MSQSNITLSFQLNISIFLHYVEGLISARIAANVAEAARATQEKTAARSERTRSRGSTARAVLRPAAADLAQPGAERRRRAVGNLPCGVFHRALNRLQPNADNRSNSGNVANSGTSFVDPPSSVGYRSSRGRPPLQRGCAPGADISLAAVICRGDQDTVTRPLLHGEADIG